MNSKKEKAFEDSLKGFGEKLSALRASCSLRFTAHSLNQWIEMCSRQWLPWLGSHFRLIE